jgi:hypothetical protein
LPAFGKQLALSEVEGRDLARPLSSNFAYTLEIHMWRMGSRLFLGMLAASIFTNAIAVYLLHDVDADRIGRLNLAYWDLTLEFLVFTVVVAAVFLLVSWIGSLVLRLRVVNSGLKLGFALGVAVILIQYPAEFIARKLSFEHSADSFLLAYLLLAPICCAAIIFLDAHKRRSAD